MAILTVTETSPSRAGKSRILLALLAISACSSYPQARYFSAVNAHDKEGSIGFCLQASLITITPTAPAEPREVQGKTQERQDKTQDRQDKTQVNEVLSTLGLAEDQTLPVAGIQGWKAARARALVTPMDAARSLYVMEPNDSFLMQSNMSVTYYEGHHRIKTIGTEFQDNRIAAIQAVGGLIAAIIPTLAYDESATTARDDIELPLVLDFTDPDRFSVHGAFTSWSNVPGHRTWWYRYKVAQPEGRVYKTNDYFAAHDGRFVREFPVSSCTDMTLEIGKGNTTSQAEDNSAVYVVRVPDPTFVEPVPIPRKGSIIMHATCGADVAMQSTQTANSLMIMEAIAKQVEAIWKAQKSGSNKPKPASKPAPGDRPSDDG